MITWLKEVFSSYDQTDAPVEFDPWLSTEITEEKIRNLVRVRIRYVGNVVPNVPDLSTLLEEMICNNKQRDAVCRIWAEEAESYLNQKIAS